MRKQQRGQRQLVEQFMQLSMSAPWVIARRMTDLALAGPNAFLQPSAESRRMVTEKMAAGAESANALAWSMASWPMTLLAAWTAPSAPKADALVGHTLDTATRVLRPYARRARANARRLARKK